MAWNCLFYLWFLFLRWNFKKYFKKHSNFQNNQFFKKNFFFESCVLYYYLSTRIDFFAVEITWVSSSPSVLLLAMIVAEAPEKKNP